MATLEAGEIVQNWTEFKTQVTSDGWLLTWQVNGVTEFEYFEDFDALLGFIDEHF